MFYLSLKFNQICSSSYKQHNLRHDLTSDLIVTLALGVGTQLLCTTYLLIMFYLSVKFRYICFSSFWVIAETRFWPLTWLRPWPWAYEPKSCAGHIFSLCFIFLWSFIKFASVVYGWLMTCNFTSFSNVFQTYQDDERLIMNGCVQWNSVCDWEDFFSSRDWTRGR